MRKVMLLVLVGGCVVLGGATVRKRSDKRMEAMKLEHAQILKEYAGRMWRLAMDYAQAKDYARARQLLKQAQTLVKDDARINTLQDQLEKFEVAQNRKQLRLDVQRGWIDTGCRTTKGHRFFVVTNGVWTLRFAKQLDADGLKLTKETKRFPLGALIGRVGLKGPTFLVGSSAAITAKATDTIYLKLNVDDRAACKGFLTCVVSGTYVKQEK